MRGPVRAFTTPSPLSANEVLNPKRGKVEVETKQAPSSTLPYSPLYDRGMLVTSSRPRQLRGNDFSRPKRACEFDFPPVARFSVSFIRSGFDFIPSSLFFTLPLYLFHSFFPFFFIFISIFFLEFAKANRSRFRFRSFVDSNLFQRNSIFVMRPWL